MTKLQEAMALLRAGDRQAGKQLLAEVLAAEPANTTAWLWMSSAVEDAEQRSYCMCQILKIDPEHKVATAALAQLGQAPPLVAPSSPAPAPPAAAPPGPAWSPPRAPAPAPVWQATSLPVAAADPYDAQNVAGDRAPDPKQEKTDLVVKQLAKHVGLNDIVYSLCQTWGMSWPQAEAFVRDVEQQNRSRIARRQSPILLLVGGITLLVGVYLAYNSASYLAATTGSLLGSKDNLALVILDAPFLLRRVIVLAVGMAMVVGGLLGTLRTIMPPSEALISSGHVESSIDDVVDVGVYAGHSDRHGRRRRGTKIL